MKKYFCTETDEVVNFGDTLNLTLHKVLEDGEVTVVKNIPLTENSVDLLSGLGLIEEREVEDEEGNDLLDFEEGCEALNELLEAFETLEQRVDKLEERIGKLESMEGLVKTIHGTVLNIQKALKKKQ